MSLTRPPLELPDERWHSRWLVLESWRVLHRISAIEPVEPEDMINGPGVAVCGARGHFMVPGLLSRMGRPRCRHCCRLLGIPAGDGAPYNAGEPWSGA